MKELTFWMLFQIVTSVLIFFIAIWLYNKPEPKQYAVIETVETTIKCHGTFLSTISAKEYVNSISINGEWQKNVYSLDKIVNGQGLNKITIWYSIVRLK